MPKTSISVRIWGARGSIPTPGPKTIRYGGNTSCVEMVCGGHTLVFDAGSGLRMLGNAIAQRNGATDIDLFLSHCHIDHVIGLPFFTPVFEAESKLRIWGGSLDAAGGIRQAVHKMMSYPLFPIEMGMAKGQVEFSDFKAGETLSPRAGISVRTAPLTHPGGATGYRVEYEGRAVAYVTDTELSDAALDPALLALVKDADLLIIDATYTDAELPDRVGWGHASWQQTVSLADAAGVKRLCLYHHDPEHDDETMDAIAEAVVKARAGTIVASEGMTVEI